MRRIAGVDVWFQLELARATQRFYDPEFLPDDNRPRGLPWGSVGDDAHVVSESWGTLRFGSLVEILLYDVRRTCTLAGPNRAGSGSMTGWWPR